MMAVQAQFNDNDYKNWVRACLGLQFLKEGIVHYVDAEVQTLHRNILTNVCQSVTCNGCTTDDLTRRRPCPNNVCDKIRTKLQAEHRYRQPEWTNTDATRWCTDHWEIAKGFMSKGYKTVASSADTDTAGLLSVCINGLFMPCAGQIIPPHLQPLMDSFHKNREARNAILHSGSMSISDGDRQNYIQDMVALLATYKQPIDLVTQAAIQNLRQLNGGIFITPTNELVALKARLEVIESSQQDLVHKVDTVQHEQQTFAVDQHNLQQDHQRVDTAQQNLDSKVDVVQQDQKQISEKQRNLDCKVNVIQQDLEQVGLQQKLTVSKVDTIQQDHERMDIKHQTLETNIDKVKQEHEQANVNQQRIDNRINVMQQDYEIIDSRQQTLENKLVVLNVDHERVDAKQQITVGRVDAMQQEQERVSTKQKQIVSTIDALQHDQKKVDVKQSELERKFDTMQLGHEHAEVKHQLDISAMENQHKKNGESLAILKDKVVELQMNTDKDVSEIQEFHSILQAKNDTLNDNLTILSSCAKHQQFQIDGIKDQVVGQETRIAHLEDTKSGQMSQIQQLIMKQTGNQGARVDHLNDQVAHQEKEMNKQSALYENHESRMDRIEMKTGSQLSHMGQLLNQTSDQATQQESRISGLEDSTRNLETKVRVTEEQRLTTDEARARPAEFASTGVSKQDKDKSIKGIQNYLLEMYNEDVSTIPIAPLLQRIKANIDDVYTELLIRDDLVHTEKKQSNSNRYKVESYQDVLNDGTKQCKNVFVVGKAGVGKTTWSRKLVNTWCGVMTKTDRNDISSLNDKTLVEYDLVFYLELRHAKSDSHILEMIEHQLFRHETSMMADVKALLETDNVSSRCLIVLDGLDEWVSRDQCTTKHGLPARDPRWKSAIITTTRSWKLEELQLESQKIDRAVEIRGLAVFGTRKLVKKVVSALNVFSGKNKNADEFNSKCHVPIRECMHVPLLLTIFVCLWYEEGEVDQSLAATYCGLVELLIKYAVGDAKIGLIRNVPTKLSDEIKQSWKKEIDRIPDFIAKRRMCGMYYPFLLRLGKIGFDHLFSQTKESSLVFDHQSIKDVISDDELDFALNIGILSKTTHRGSVLEQEFSLSFLHKTVQEFLAAVYMVSQGIESNQSLTTYKQYCKSPYKVLEMENIIMFVSGLCPELAGEMSCHIADMGREETIHKMLLRCVRQERATSTTSRHIYIKHHFLYSNSLAGNDYIDGVDYTMEIVEWLNIPTGKDTTLELSGNLNDDVLKSIADIRHVKLTAARLALDGTRNVILEFSHLDTERRCNPVNSVSLSIHLAAEYIEELDISYYRSSEARVLDLTNCKSLRALKYVKCSVPVKLPVEQLENVEMNVRLEEVEITDYTPYNELELDLSGCKSLRKVFYKQSTAPIRLPPESLECVNIFKYRPDDMTELDLSGCKSLRTVHYKDSTAPICLPSRRLENVTVMTVKPIEDLTKFFNEIFDGAGLHERNVDAFFNKQLDHQFPTTTDSRGSILEETIFNVECCYQYLTEIQLPSDGLKTAEIIKKIKISEEIALDFSGCECLRKVLYEHSTKQERAFGHMGKVNTFEDTTVPIRLPSKQLEEVTIINYNPSDKLELDLSKCHSLRKVCYDGSIVPIRLPSEHIKEVRIVGYKLTDKASKQISIRANYQSISPAEKRHQPDHKDNMVQIGCQSGKETLLDLSGCETLETVQYDKCTVPIRLPPKCLKEVKISEYRPYSKMELVQLDLSKYYSLRKVCYDGSMVPIRLPSEHLERLTLVGYEYECDDISITADYQSISLSEPQMQLDRQENAVNIGCHHMKMTILDLSSCEKLRTVHYKQSTVPIRLPYTPLEEVRISDYRPHFELELDISGCQSLRKVYYQGFIVPICLPCEYLKAICVFEQSKESGVHELKQISIIANYQAESSTDKRLQDDGHDKMVRIGCQPGKEVMMDLSSCETLRNEQSTVPKRQPSRCLEEVKISDCRPHCEVEVDIPGCQSLEKVEYQGSTVSMHLPCENMKDISISGYGQIEKSWSYKSEPISITAKYKCRSSPIEKQMLLNLQCEVVHIGCQPDKETMLDLSGCETLRTVHYKKSTVPIRLPYTPLEDVRISDFRPQYEVELDISGCQSLKKVYYQGFIVPICLPCEHLEEINVFEQSKESSVHELKLISITANYKPESSTEKRLQDDGHDKMVRIGCQPGKEVMMDLSSCETLRNEQSTVPKRQPSRCLEEVKISDCRPHCEVEVDIPRCRSLKKVDYRGSTVSMHLPCENMKDISVSGYGQVEKSGSYKSEPISITAKYKCRSSPTEKQAQRNLQCEVVHIGCQPDKATMLDLSSCETLGTVHYKNSTVPIRLPYTPLEEVGISDYRPQYEVELDISGCQSLRKVYYQGSIVPICLPCEYLEDISVSGYGQIEESWSYKSEPISITANYHCRSSSREEQIQLDHQSKVVKIGCQPVKEATLDLSDCESLRTVYYEHNTVPIRLPSRCLEEVTIFDYRPHFVLDMDLSGCQSLRKVYYHGSRVPICLPYDYLNDISVYDYEQSKELSAHTLELYTEKPLQSDNQDEMVRLYCQANEEAILDLSGCESPTNEQSDST